jgi:general transcription factor 3C polypeptide 5 (transcription factor C subunit 1)
MFDGVILTSETAAFQLHDITDTMLKQVIDEEEDIRERCSVSMG